MKIFSVEEANQSILKRKPFNRIEYAPIVLERTESYFGPGVKPPQAVQMILNSVEEDGDSAVCKWSALLDKYDAGKIKFSKKDLKQAWGQLSPKLQKAMRLASDRIRKFHSNQIIQSWVTSDLGGQLGQRVTPIESVGIYVPGGTAPLPSSLLMGVIPAQVAGVKQIVVATPPNSDQSILAAAYLCEVDAVYQVGGAQAIAALAFGTETIPRVDKIVGAGNLFVTLAKQQLYGVVGLDGLAGPTETMIIADNFANPAWIAADLLAQAEHDVLASAILLTPDSNLAKKVQKELNDRIKDLSRKETIAVSFENASGIVMVDSLDQAAELANTYGAEHLCLSVENPESLMDKINNAGGFFLGEHSFEVLGDYVAGPSHVMPTGGTARFASPLSVMDFIKISSVIGLDASTAKDLCDSAVILAETENLTAHAASARTRLEEI